MQCSVQDCEKTVYVRGWCQMHYTRWKRHGDPRVLVKPRNASVAERFWPKVEVRDSTECWPWRGARSAEGYGRLGAGGAGRAPLYAHRVAFELSSGPIPEGRWVLHRCDNPPCCNPGHLFLGDALANVHDMYAKGRDRTVFRSVPPSGEANPQHKLTAEQVREIREKYATGTWIQRDIAQAYGISRTLVSFIVTGKAWKHITHGKHVRPA